VYKRQVLKSFALALALYAVIATAFTMVLGVVLLLGWVMWRAAL